VVRAAWRPIRGVDSGRLREARLEAHHALQWLARAARAFVMMHPDDRHTNLGWDDALDGFSTHFLTNDVVLRLSIADLTLAVQAGGRGAELFTLDGRTDADVGRWLERMLAAHGLDPGRVVAELPYQIADRTMAHGAAYDTGRMGDALSELAAWFANADRSLGRIREQMIARGFAPSPVRTWPHHFDMATLTLLETGDAELVRSVNAGFSPGDENYEEPYFYVSPHPYPDPSKLPALSSGHWHTRGFTAAILPASQIIPMANRQAAADAFLDAATAAVMGALA
jgi:hypothetical protein